MCFLLWLQHSFVGQPGLSRSLAVELLDKVNNPENHAHYGEVDDDDFEVTNPFSSLPFIKTGTWNALLCLGNLKLQLKQQLLLLLLVFPHLCCHPSLQPHSVIRHTIRSTNRNVRAERTASEINCEFCSAPPFLGLLCLWGHLPKKSLSIWEANPGEAACESSIIIIQN